MLRARITAAASAITVDMSTSGPIADPPARPGPARRCVGTPRGRAPARHLSGEKAVGRQGAYLAAQPLRFFAAEFIREAAFEMLEDEIPYALAAEIEEFREAVGRRLASSP